MKELLTGGIVTANRRRVSQSAVAIVSSVSVTLLTFTCLVVFSVSTGARSGKTDSEIQATSAAKTAAATAEKKFEDIDLKNFTNSTNIDNKWMPLKPGTRFVYEGKTVEDDGTIVPHRVVINVTDVTKVIGGIRSAVTWDLDYSDGELVEAELAFFAQDNAGNVWRMGEYPEEYDAGKVVAAPAWIHGFEEARAGIMMKASPQPGTPSYSQGWGPAVGWTDRGKVDQIGQKTSVPAGSYADVLVIAETSASEANAQQLKYYAPGVGNVKVGWRGAGEKTKETLDLTKVERLDAKAMSEVRAGALKMEKSAYTRSKNVYGRTTPLEPAPGAKTPATK
jgi:hypothetical protein